MRTTFTNNNNKQQTTLVNGSVLFLRCGFQFSSIPYTTNQPTNQTILTAKLHTFRCAIVVATCLWGHFIVSWVARNSINICGLKEGIKLQFISISIPFQLVFYLVHFMCAFLFFFFRNFFLFATFFLWREMQWFYCSVRVSTGMTIGFHYQRLLALLSENIYNDCNDLQCRIILLFFLFLISVIVNDYGFLIDGFHICWG